MYDCIRSRTFIQYSDDIKFNTNDINLTFYTNDQHVDTPTFFYKTESHTMNIKYQISRFLTHNGNKSYPANTLID